MPSLCDISYSRETCIDAIRKYYQFLAKMYLDPAFIIEPPPGGWPFGVDTLRDLGKSDEVISLLRHLPFIRDQNDLTVPQVSPGCYFADWNMLAGIITSEEYSGEDVRLITEGSDLYEITPPHVISITGGGRDNPVFLIDTVLGIVLWYECPINIWLAPSRERVLDDPWDNEYAGEDEVQAQWRGDSKAWSIVDFFELLKDQFKELKYVPIGPRRVMGIDEPCHPSRNGMTLIVREIYRNHGWPDFKRFDKALCLSAVFKALKEHYSEREMSYFM